METHYIRVEILIRYLAALVLIYLTPYHYLQPAEARPLAHIMVSGHITFSVSASAPPFSFTDHEDVLGIDVDLGRKLAERLGLKAQFNTRDNADGLDANADVTMNVITQMTSGPSLFLPQKANGHFIPYFIDSLVIIASPEAVDVDGISLISTKGKIGVVQSSMADHALTASYKEKEQQQSKIKPYKNFAALLEGFRSSEVALLMAPLSQAAIAMRSAGRKVRYVKPEFVPQSLRKWNITLGVNTAHDALAQILKENIEHLRKSGAIQKIFARYSVPYVHDR